MGGSRAELQRAGGGDGEQLRVTFIGGERWYPGWGNTHAELVLLPWRFGRKNISASRRRLSRRGLGRDLRQGSNCGAVGRDSSGSDGGRRAVKSAGSVSRRCWSSEATGRAGVLMAAVASRRGPARCADQGGGRECGACTRCRVVLLRAVLGFVRMLKVADDDLCTARSLQARLASVGLVYVCLHAVYVCACVLSLVQDGWRVACTREGED
jgi:hypothetical protein